MAARPDNRDSKATEEQAQKPELLPIEAALLGPNLIAALRQDPHHTDMYVVNTASGEYEVAKTPNGRLVGRRNTGNPSVESMGIIALGMNEMVIIYGYDPEASEPNKLTPLAHIVRDGESNYHVNVYNRDRLTHHPDIRRTLLVGTNPGKSIYPALLPDASIDQCTPIPTVSRAQFAVREISAGGGRGVLLDNIGKNDILISDAYSLPKQSN